MLDWTRTGSVAVLSLAHGPVNALDVELLDAIARSLGEIERSESRAVVLTGRGPAFSAGADLYRVLAEGAGYLDAAGRTFAAALEALFTFPRPVVAAVNGAAIAGGCVLACACDYRLAAWGDGRIGLAELRVGVPFPTWALEIVRFAVGPERLRSLVYTGRLLRADEAREAGLVDEVVDAGALLDRALEVAERMAQIPERTFRLTKRALNAPVIDRVARVAPEQDAAGKEAWASPEVRDAIRGFLRRTLGTDAR